MIGPQGRNALNFAVDARQPANIGLLLSAGANPLQKDQQGNSVIDNAFAAKSPYVKALIAKVPTQQWQPAWLPKAAQQGREELTQFLLTGGMDVDTRDDQDRTALWHAANQGHSAVIQSLLQHNADPLAQDKEGNTPLHRAALHTPALTALLPAIAAQRLNPQNANGSSPLHLAASAGNSASCQLLINAGADKDLRDHNGNTPLLQAVLAHQSGTVKALLEQGASLQKRNNNKQDAIAIARQLHYDDISQLLEQARSANGVLGIFR